MSRCMFRTALHSLSEEIFRIFKKDYSHSLTKSCLLQVVLCPNSWCFAHCFVIYCRYFLLPSILLLKLEISQQKILRIWNERPYIEDVLKMCIYKITEYFAFNQYLISESFVVLWLGNYTYRVLYIWLRVSLWLILCYSLCLKFPGNLCFQTLKLLSKCSLKVQHNSCENP